jgi:thiamine biosynthesis lipoprotein
MFPTITRRRFVAITAAGGALLATGIARAAVPLHVWEGTALGARASLRLYHPDPAAAARLFETCRREIARLEQVFSLYRPDSAVSRLNAEGALDAPPLDLVRLLDESRRLGTLTGGVFDVTVQPLWLLYARHFATGAADPAGPPAAAVAEAAARVGQDALEVAPAQIAFARPGMAVTLNGIAQGYVTDRVAELLRREGLDRVLVDLGEARALGGHPDGRPWRAALADPLGGRPTAELDLRDRALATSAPSGFAFDAAGRFHHIFDPRSGRPAGRYASVSVLAPDATVADALSTAFVQMSGPEIRAVAAQHGAVAVRLLHRDGSVEELPPAS